jgi:hypothetical protein
MKRVSIVAMATFGVFVTSLSCGSGSSGPGSSIGLPRTTLLGMLTPSQAGTFCDWTNEKQGGYGRSVTCADGSQQHSDVDKATCVSVIPQFATICPTLTVGDAEDCLNAIGRDQCKVSTDLACTNVHNCLH